MKNAGMASPVVSNVPIPVPPKTFMSSRILFIHLHLPLTGMLLAKVFIVKNIYSNVSNQKSWKLDIFL